MLHRLLLVCAACALTASSSGCAGLWLVGRATDTEWRTSSYEEVQPSVEREQRLVLEPRYAPPEPVAYVEAPPASEPPPPEAQPCDHGCAPEAPVAVPPPPGPPPEPLPDGSLVFRCNVMNRAVTERVRLNEWSYEKPIWTIIAGFVVLGEGLIAASALMDARTETNVRNRNGMLAVGGLFALDALGMAVIAFHPEEHHVREFARPGAWTQTEGCPDDLWIAAGGARVRVTPEGTVEGGLGREALLAFAQPDAPLTLRWGTREVDVNPIPEARCRWARDQAVDAPQIFCRHADAPLRLYTPLTTVSIDRPATAAEGAH